MLSCCCNHRHTSTDKVQFQSNLDPEWLNVIVTPRDPGKRECIICLELCNGNEDWIGCKKLSCQIDIPVHRHCMRNWQRISGQDCIVCRC